MARYVYMTSNYNQDGLNLVAGCIYSAVYDITVAQSDDIISGGFATAVPQRAHPLLDIEFRERNGN